MIAQRNTTPDADSSRRALARENLIVFTKRLNPRYEPATHLWRIAESLQAVEAGDYKRVLYTIPPRHGKSELASIHFPPWVLGRNPDKRIIAASYAATLAYGFSRRARNIIAHPLYPFDIRTAGDLSNVQRWDIAGHRGGYLSAGIGGGIAGHGADFLMIDDAVGSAEQAASQVYRDRAWDWFTQDAYTRLEPDAAIILIGTRWHEDDLIGRALNSKEEWHHVDLPALDEEGNALWPERFNAERLEEIKQQIGTHAFIALYQQRPGPKEGAIIKKDWWGYFREPLPPYSKVIQSWDTAFKKGEENDFSVCLTMGVGQQFLDVLDVHVGKWEFPELKRQAREQYEKWRPSEIVIEDKGSGQSLVQELRAAPDWRYAHLPEALRPPTYILPVVAFSPEGDKLLRINTVSPYVEGGRVRLLSPGSWHDDFIDELATFPGGAHDDQVDAFSMAILRIVGRENAVSPLSDVTLSYFSELPEEGF